MEITPEDLDRLAGEVLAGTLARLVLTSRRSRRKGFRVEGKWDKLPYSDASPGNRQERYRVAILLKQAAQAFRKGCLTQLVVRKLQTLDEVYYTQLVTQEVNSSVEPVPDPDGYSHQEPGASVPEGRLSSSDPDEAG